MKMFFKVLKPINFPTLFDSNLSCFGKIKKRRLLFLLRSKIQPRATIGLHFKVGRFQILKA